MGPESQQGKKQNQKKVQMPRRSQLLRPQGMPARARIQLLQQVQQKSATRMTTLQAAALTAAREVPTALTK